MILVRRAKSHRLAYKQAICTGNVLEGIRVPNVVRSLLYNVQIPEEFSQYTFKESNSSNFSFASLFFWVISY